MKQSRTIRTYRRRWLVLTPERLCSFKAERQYECPTEEIDLKLCSEVSMANDLLTFTVRAGRTFYLAASSNAERSEWIAAIGLATTESRDQQAQLNQTQQAQLNELEQRVIAAERTAQANAVEARAAEALAARLHARLAEAEAEASERSAGRLTEAPEAAAVAVADEGDAPGTAASEADAEASEAAAAASEAAAMAVATPEQLQAKFVQDGAGVLAYSSISTFFGGLEAIVGGPSPQVGEAMAAEHTQRGDSKVKLTARNYGIETTSALEWRFVAEPQRPPKDGWPLESKLVGIDGPPTAAHSEVERKKLIEAGARPRVALSLGALELRMETKNGELRALGEPPLILEEGLGVRLYTGPLFVKYVGVMRGLNSEVAFLRTQMVRLCCAAAIAEKYTSGALTFDAMRASHLNTYTSTIHAINSAIVKLSKLTVATKVFRGMHSMVLPPQFQTVNEYGVKGAIESGFMSTTTAREVAMSYAAQGSTAGHILEMQQGMIDRGADIRFLSQYPHEAEILFAPLTGLEVRSTRAEGSVLVVEVSLSVNLASLTIEQVIGKRKKVLQDMVPGLLTELRQQTRREGLATRAGVEYLSAQLRAKCEEGALRREDWWYNVDAQLQVALGELLAVSRAMAPGGVQRAEALAALDEGTCDEYGFPSAAFTQETMQLVQELGGTNGRRALKELGKLEDEAAAMHSAAVAKLLEDAAIDIRSGALRALTSSRTTSGACGDAVVVREGAAIVRLLTDSSPALRDAAFGTLSHCEKAVVQQSAAIALLLEHQVDSGSPGQSIPAAGVERGRAARCARAGARPSARPGARPGAHSGRDTETDAASVRVRALELLGKSPKVVVQQGAAIVKRLVDPDQEVRRLALQVLGTSAKAVAQHSAAAAQLLEDPDAGVRIRALELLGKSADAVVQQGAAIARLLEDLKGDKYVRKYAVRALGKSVEAMARHGAAVAQQLEVDAEVDVRMSAMVALGKVEDVVQQLDDATDDTVRKAAAEALGASPEAVSQHSATIARLLEHSNWSARRFALKILSASSDAVAQHREEMAQRLEDSDESVRKVAAEALGRDAATIRRNRVEGERQYRAARERADSRADEEEDEDEDEGEEEDEEGEEDEESEDEE